MTPPVLFDHCHLRGCDVELEEQCLGLLDQLRYCRHRRHQLYLPRPCSRKYARLAEHCGPDILGTNDDFLDNRSTDANKGATRSFTAYNLPICNHENVWEAVESIDLWVPG